MQSLYDLVKRFTFGENFTFGDTVHDLVKNCTFWEIIYDLVQNPGRNRITRFGIILDANEPNGAGHNPIGLAKISAFGT